MIPSVKPDNNYLFEWTREERKNATKCSQKTSEFYCDTDGFI